MVQIPPSSFTSTGSVWAHALHGEVDGHLIPQHTGAPILFYFVFNNSKRIMPSNLDIVPIEPEES